MRRIFIAASFVVLGLNVALFYLKPEWLWNLWITGPLLLIGWYDVLQRKQTIRKNFPLVGRFRYLFEAIRPEIQQYFIETNTDGTPFSREERSVVYQRAKHTLDTLPFGTQRDVYEVGYEWANHSIFPQKVKTEDLRVTVGGPDCKQPYSASILNVSAMSYGSLSKNAILALNGGAKDGGFAHNTGEGGLSPYHLAPGGDIIWQIGTGYFGCRDKDGNFSESEFKKRALLPQVKMIEVKLSQGAKPGHGGILPGKKVTKEISLIRGVEMGKDVISPPGHKMFNTPIEMMQFIGNLRKWSDGKPVGFKLCLGKRREFIAVVKAMMQTRIYPDFITVDGGEGGTGAAPVEFSNHVGFPLVEAIAFVHNTLVGFGIRKRIRVIASGKVSMGFDIIKRLALGADMVNAARAMLLALGCIQALRCNSNHCPTGIATQDPELVAGLDVPDKRQRVATYHRETLHAFAEILGAMGLKTPGELRPWHVMRRTSPIEVKHYGEIFDYVQEGAFLADAVPPAYFRAFHAASADSFRSIRAD